VKPGTQKSGTRHNKFLKKNKEHFRMRVKNIHVQTLSESSYSIKEGSIENEREDRLLPRNISPLKHDAQSHHQINKDPSNLNEFDSSAEFSEHSIISKKHHSRDKSRQQQEIVVFPPMLDALQQSVTTLKEPSQIKNKDTHTLMMTSFNN
jgi:hypothetical protein